jgi:hypothetical protein
VSQALARTARSSSSRGRRKGNVHDAQERYLAISATSIVVNPGNTLLRRDGTVLGRVDDAGEGLSLDLRAHYPGGLEPDAGDRFDETTDVLADARRLQADPDLAERAYGRAVKDGEWLWLQYFFWEYYNPKHLLGFGRHEGDWASHDEGRERREHR